MKLTALVDNIPDEGKVLQSEHGLSFWLQTDEKNILIDTGATSLFADNARKIGINIADADYLILSHAHADHTGGLETFLTMNDKAKIFLSSNACGRHCFSTRRGIKRDISIDHNLLHHHKERFIFTNKNTALTNNVKLICEITDAHPTPKANATLLAGEAPDDFSHEIVIAVTSCNETTTIISPCSHRGILNILDAVKGCKITKFIGGLHLLDSDEKNSFESVEEIHSLADEILKRDISLSTGHCTGLTAKEILSKKLRNRFTEFHSGFTMQL